MDSITPDLIRDAESAHTSGRMRGRSSIEVLVRADRRRSWTAEQKREIVIESLNPEQRAADVARKHGITTGQLYTWRRQTGEFPSRCPGPPDTAVCLCRADHASPALTICPHSGTIITAPG